MLPYLRVPSRADVRLLVTTNGHPIIPAKNDVVIVEGEEFIVMKIEWDYSNERIVVFAEPFYGEQAKTVVTANTLPKVYNALRRLKLSDVQVNDVVNEILNEGVLFRERKAD